jgi:Protein of unknown function (DUF3298)
MSTPRSRFLRNIAILSVGVILVTACASLAPASTPTPPPTSTPVATATSSLALYQQVTLTSIPSEEDSQSPAYKITTQTPSLTGSDDPRVTDFNAEMVAQVNKAIADFKQNLSELTVTPVTAGSYFDLRYKLLSPPGDILSLEFQMEGYVSGSAHPYHLSQTVNYDLGRGKDIALIDLFLPSSSYLDTIAAYCAAQLSSRNIGFDSGFAEGAGPTPQNYRNWNITADGLLITFDEYQVAPYVAGPQTVVVPYSELKSFIDPHGLLAKFIQ